MRQRILGTGFIFPFIFILFSQTAWPMGKRPPLPEEIPAPQTLPRPTLEECFELALERSETVAIEKEQIEEAESQFFIAASEALGDVHFEMTDKRQDIRKGGGGGEVASSFNDPVRRERKFVIKQPLFQGFKALGALTGAGSLRKSEKEEWQRAKELLFLDVARAFYGLLRERKELEIATGTHSLLGVRVRELEERERIGRSRPSEVATAKSHLRIVEAERAKIRGLAAVARHVLEFLTGLDLEGRELQEEEVPGEEAGGIATYLADLDSRHDVEAARQSAKTAWRGVIVAQSGFWPDLSIEHNQYERREGFQSDLDWDFLFKINIPLFQGGGALGNFKKSLSQWRQEKLNYSRVKREAELDIKENYEYWKASLEESRSLEEAVRAAEENLRLQSGEYARNLVSNLDVLAALESLHTTRRDANLAHYEMKENYWKLKVAAGELGA